jgi:ubiquinone/menaquinone biosynthesis C-methylase UbiE
LEVGCGNGADGVLFALNGADYTGVDLTQTAVDATRKHFEELSLPGRFQVENAESLSFDNASFDAVYSFGVLHHTDNIRKALSEIYRVLKPGGNFICMLYNKRSFNYVVRIMCYMRARLLVKILSRLGKWDLDRTHLQPRPIAIGNLNPWNAHYENFLQQGWSYLKAANFIHRATDGPDCPIAHVFTTSEAFRLMAEAKFRDIEIKIAHFPLRHYLGDWLPLTLEKKLASKMGWHLMILEKKPAIFK